MEKLPRAVFSLKPVNQLSNQFTWKSRLVRERHITFRDKHRNVNNGLNHIEWRLHVSVLMVVCRRFRRYACVGLMCDL